jgi:hypothetical protein
MMLKSKKIPIEETIGAGLPTLLAINLKLVDGELPKKGKRHDSGVSSLPKILELFGKGKYQSLQNEMELSKSKHKVGSLY